LRQKFQIPYPVASGLQFKPILLPNGKRPPFDKDDPPPIALHLEIDEFYYGRYKKEIAKLFRSGSRASINGLTLRLIPCFSAKGNRMAFDSDTTAHLVELAHRQKQFLSSQLIEIRTKLFALLDTPLSDTNEMTLHRHIMSRAPEKIQRSASFITSTYPGRSPMFVFVRLSKHIKQLPITP
jgi:hypothetical protein